MEYKDGTLFFQSSYQNKRNTYYKTKPSNIHYLLPLEILQACSLN